MSRLHDGSLSTLPATAALTAANALAISMFMAGFLLTRVELPKFSYCSEPPASFDFMTEFSKKHDFSAQYQLVLERWVQSGMPHLEGTQATAAGCWNSRRFRKAVLIIIDAMRFDFVHIDPDESETKNNLNFRGHLRLFEEYQNDEPENARIFIFEADPPTTTMQRLKGLVTGGMPTFIDFSSNFDNNAITEDNILFQFQQIGFDIVMMGDDTWIKLFPNAFRRSYPYPSFNVKDLHTVDNGVIAHLLPEIAEGKFDLLIAHFLGVDHVGHRFYANHPSMKDKLTQLDSFLRNVVSAIDDETVLFVLGDHGMTSEGNHGGTTKQETNTALFAYSKQKIFPRWNQTHFHPQIKQVDFVPTLSLLLGSSIPYSSVGTIMTDLFSFNDTTFWLHICGALRINAWQVQRYLHDYSSHSHIFEPELMQHLTADFLAVDRDYIQLSIQLQSEQFDAETAYMDLAKRYEAVLSRSQSMCREKWTMFDMEKMIFGTILLILAGLGIGLNAGFEPIVTKHYFLKFVSLTAIIVTPLIWFWSELSLIASFSIAVAAGLLLPTFVSSWLFPRRNLGLPHPTVLISIAFIIPYMGGLFSNSIVITESFVFHYYAISFCILLGLFDLRFASADVSRIVLITFLSILSLKSMGDGSSFGPGAMLMDEFFSFWQIVQTFGSLAALTIASSIYSKCIQHPFLRLFFNIWLLASFGIISTYWYLDASVLLDQHTSWHFLPQLVYGSSLFLTILTVVFSTRLTRQMSFHLLTASIVTPCFLLLGPKSPFVFMMTLIVIYLRYLRLVCLKTYVHNGIPDCMFFWILGIRLYFATGHSNSFSSLQVSAAFVGFEQFDYYRSGFLLLLNTFGSFIVCGLGLAIVSPDYTTAQVERLHKSDYRKRGYAFERPAMIVIGLHAIRSAFSTLNVLFNRRHLMVWDVFAPKFVFDTVSFTAVAFIMLSLALLNKVI